MSLLFTNYCAIMLAMAFLLLSLDEGGRRVEATTEAEPLEDQAVQPPFVQISKSKMKRLLDILNARSRQKSENQEDATPFPINTIRDAIVPISLKYIRPSRPLSENRDIVGWERLGWGWK